MEPVSVLPKVQRCSSVFPWQRNGGNGPTSSLELKSTLVRLELRPKSTGSLPENLLLNSLRTERLGFVARVWGISPWKLLSLRPSSCKGIPAILAGKIPVRLF